MSIQRFIARHRVWLALTTVLVVLTGLGAGLFLSAYLKVLHEGFRERSIAYAQSFAASARPWVERGETEMLQSAARLLLSGSALYVLISDGEQFVIDERGTFSGEFKIDPRSTPTSITVSLESAAAGPDYLAIQTPLEAVPSGGYVLIGIDRGAVFSQASGAMAAAAAMAFAFDMIIAGLLFLGLHIRRRELIGTTRRTEAVTLKSGPIEVDTTAKSVRLQGEDVRVTPKQYRLIELLASEPGRVFSEEDILAAAWPDSPYADAKDIKQYVYLVRQRLAEVDPTAKQLIETVPGFGYRLADRDIDQELTP